MSNIVSSANYIQQESVQAGVPVSESSAFSMGGSINYLLDTTTTHSSQIASVQGQVTGIIALGSFMQVTNQFNATVTNSYTVPSGRVATVRIRPSNTARPQVTDTQAHTYYASPSDYTGLGLGVVDLNASFVVTLIAGETLFNTYNSNATFIMWGFEYQQVAL